MSQDAGGIMEVNPNKTGSKSEGCNVRLFLVKALFENLMGPKNGPEERISNPRFQYVVGVLKTAFLPPSSDEPMIPNDPSQEDRSEKYHGKSSKRDWASYDEELYGNDEESMSVDQDLNPILGARSMGISFVVSGNPPSISICATWGRYEKQFGKKKSWLRRSNFYTMDIILNKRYKKIPMRQGTCRDGRISRDGAVLVVNSHPIKGSTDMYRISVFLVNETKFKERQSIVDDIFQPQIRINGAVGTKFHPLRSVVTNDIDSSQKILIGERRVLASGHFCGALWKEVDPEDNDMHGFGAFTWPDSRSCDFPEGLRRKFTRPDLRTEYFPSYSILQPEIPERMDLSASVLAESWDSKKMESMLSALPKEYGRWIDVQENSLEDKSPEMRDAGEKNVKKCRNVLGRIRRGIKFLVTDENARAAFCFMNKVMATKMKWESGREFSWHEFQIAFILHCLEGVAQKNTDERDICDVLWFPTGGGKTEAYLGLLTFAIAYRRLITRDDFVTDGGVSVISRYTLRLLTLQQFQRTVGALVAADFLRISRWVPKGITMNDSSLKERLKDGVLWGRKRFSIGLWIGGGATPNKFKDTFNRATKTPILNARGMLEDKGKGHTQHNGDPAQVNFCPCCRTILSIPTSQTFGLDKKNNEIFWIFSSTKTLDELNAVNINKLGSIRSRISVKQKNLYVMRKNNGKNFYSIKIRFEYSGNESHISGSTIRQWWEQIVSPELDSKHNQAEIFSTSPTRPGYFFVKGHGEKFDFVIHCPNPECVLNKDVEWFENDPDGPEPYIPEPFRIDGGGHISNSVPISAYTIDTQIYGKCPTVMISTVDKFAILPYRNEASGIFGNVDVMHKEFGYGRSQKHTVNDVKTNPIIPLAPEDMDIYQKEVRSVTPFLPPSLIIQDELHLIEGPLGSIAGIYEVGTEILASTSHHRPKYIASSATIKEAESQVGCVFRRRVSIFPPTGTSVEDNYFSKNPEDIKSTNVGAGRLYLGVCSPNKILTVPVRVWGTLLGEIYRIRNNPEKYHLDDGFKEALVKNTGETFEEYVERVTDPYWTLVGYFSAIRELQIARSLYEDDIKELIQKYGLMEKSSYKNFPDSDEVKLFRELGAPIELTGQTDSQDLPHYLQILNQYPKNKVDAVFTTAVFGTGIDIPRLGLMTVMGQPKTTSTYIQSTGRVGRRVGGLVVTWLKSSNVRDLSHYENFVGYHRLLQSYVEPISAAPYSEMVMEECLGPICVSILRNGRSVGGTPINSGWIPQETKQGESVGPLMMKDKKCSEEVESLISEIHRIVTDPNIPRERSMNSQVAKKLIENRINLWYSNATHIANDQSGLAYNEWTMQTRPTKNVVLGSPQHKLENMAIYENSRTSMRGVEPQANFGD